MASLGGLSGESRGRCLAATCSPRQHRPMDTAAQLKLALAAADLADGVTASRFRAENLVIETKPDMTPVSEADQAAERVMRRLFEQESPGYGILGEEFGAEGPERPRWILDPIDGTMNYVRGVPVWATLVALEDSAGIVVGVVSAPLMSRRWWAARGCGAFCNAEPIRVSRVGRLADAQLSYSCQADFEEVGLGPQALALARRCRRTRGFGDFWSHMLVAEGAVDIGLDPVAALWDLAALQIIVEEAGGTLTDLSGRRRADGGSAVTSNGLIHQEVLGILAAAPSAGRLRGDGGPGWD
jgi:histidinol-phosphatase